MSTTKPAPLVIWVHETDLCGRPETKPTMPKLGWIKFKEVRPSNPVLRSRSKKKSTKKV